MLNILVTGCKGQLGSEFKNLSQDSDFQFTFSDKGDVDITNKAQLISFLKDKSFDVILNCAAYTAVDKAEDEAEKAYLINHLAVRNLVEICREQKIKLIHFSTDYVFDGLNHKPYTETDEVSPQCVYGKSKLAGEQEIIASGIPALVIRTSWLYSGFGKNFVKSMLSLGQAKDSLSIVCDQIGTPTNAKDLAFATLSCLTNLGNWKSKTEIYHFSNEGVASWYDFAKEIFDQYAIDCEIEPILSIDYPTRASRPHYSVFDKSKFKTDFNFKIKHWRDSFKALEIN
jgi:dTDP-4-dehydrorhamnose reductase